MAVCPFDDVRGRREWCRQCRFNDLNCVGLPLRREEECEGSIVLDLCIKLVEIIFSTSVSMAFPHVCSTQSVGVVACFTWQFFSADNYFGVPMVLLTMSFWDEPKYFSWLRQSGTYVLKDCRFFELSVN